MKLLCRNSSPLSSPCVSADGIWIAKQLLSVLGKSPTRTSGLRSLQKMKIDVSFIVLRNIFLIVEFARCETIEYDEEVKDSEGSFCNILKIHADEYNNEKFLSE